MDKLPDGWVQTRLGDHVDLLTGFPFKSASYTEHPDDVKLLRGDNVIQGKLRWDGVKRWPKSAPFGDKLAKYALRPGDVVLAMDRPWIEAGLKYAYIGKRDIPCLLVQRVSRLRGSNGLLTSYLRYLVGSPDFTDYIRPVVTGVAVPHISPSQIQGFRFRLPPLPTQRKIAAILSAYDDLIENNTRRIKILEEMARAIYTEWFVNFRFPGHEKVEMVESQLGPIPEGWEAKRLDEMCTVHRGRSYASRDLAETGGLPFANLKCIDRGGGFRCDGIKRYVGEFKPSQTARVGDIVVAVTDMTQERRLVAHAARIPRLGETQYVFSMDLVKVDPKPGIGREYLYGMLRFSEFPEVVKQAASGANVLHLNPSDIEDYFCILPSLDIREHYGSIAADCFAETDALRRQTSNLRQTRGLLLPKLVSGELRVSEAELTGTEEVS